jgi:hypothetical protein
VRKVRRGGVSVDVDEQLCDEDDEDDPSGNDEARRVRAVRCCAARGPEVEDKHDASTGVSAGGGLGAVTAADGTIGEEELEGSSMSMGMTSGSSWASSSD